LGAAGNDQRQDFVVPAFGGSGGEPGPIFGGPVGNPDPNFRVSWGKP
jgi:hypothetical protein